MTTFILLNSPLEQFQIVPILNLACKMLGIDYTFTNETAIIALVFGFSTLLLIIMFGARKTLVLIPGKIQGFFENIYKMVGSTVNDNTKNGGSYIFPIALVIFLYILSLNLVGLIPYSFTLTSHLIVTLALSLSLFFGLIIIGCAVKGPDFAKIFLPGGTSFILSLLLVPVEILSFIFKPISLAVRLFANMMAGHTLLKVIAGFILKVIAGGMFGILFMYIPVCILVPLFGLELGVAFIQTVVFVTLILIYFNDKTGDDH